MTFGNLVGQKKKKNHYFFHVVCVQTKLVNNVGHEERDGLV